jgi:hypothetical protein
MCGEEAAKPDEGTIATETRSHGDLKMGWACADPTPSFASSCLRGDRVSVIFVD